MASPSAENLPNGISTPPTTAPNGTNASPPTASSTQPNTQPLSQSQPLANGARSEPPIPSHPSTSLQDDGTSKRPKDAHLLHLVLAKLGVHAYTERVPLQLMDFAYRYTSGILSDAVSYTDPAGNAVGKKGKEEESGVSLNAVRTAVAARAAYQFSSALPKEFLMDMANERNRVALPKVEREFGVRLPPERYCFTGVGWGVAERWEDDVEGEEVSFVREGGPVGGAVDTVMGEAEEEAEDEFEEVMGVGQGGDTEMVDG